MLVIVLAGIIAIGLGIVAWRFLSRERGEQTLEVRPAPPQRIASAGPARQALEAGGLVADEIEKLWRLKEAGALTAEEFEAQKATLMAGRPGPDGLQLVLLDAGRNKIAVIKRVREITDCGLKEAKDLVESAPQVVASGLTGAQAGAMLRDFERDGARAEVRQA